MILGYKGYVDSSVKDLRIAQELQLRALEEDIKDAKIERSVQLATLDDHISVLRIEIRTQLQAIDDLKANEQLQRERVDNIRREAAALQTASVTAIGKVEATTDKRFEAATDRHQQLAEQTSKTLQREVAEAQFAEGRRQADITRIETSKALEILTVRLTTLEAERRGASDQKTNTGALYGWAIAGVGLIISVILAANVLFNKSETVIAPTTAPQGQTAPQ